MRSSLSVVVLALIVGAGCSNVPDPAPAAGTPTVPAAAVAPPEAVTEKGAQAGSHLGIWVWTETSGSGAPLRVNDPNRYRIEFTDATTMQVQADCNRGRADYTVSKASELTLGPIGLSKMGCPEDSLDRRFVADLARGRILKASADRLEIGLDDGSAMHFLRAK